MDEAQNSYFGFATLRVVNALFAFELRDATWKTQWNRWWTLLTGCGSSKLCLSKNCRMRPKHRIIRRDQKLQDQTKTAAVEVKLRLIFSDHHLCCIHRVVLWLRVEDMRLVDQFRRFPADLPARLWGSYLIKEANTSKGTSALLPDLLTWNPLPFGTPTLDVRALWYPQQ